MSDILSYTPIASGYRFIKDGSAYDKYFPKPDRQDNIKVFDGDVDDTVELMKRVVWTYIDDTKKIAPVFKRATVKDTCQAIWEFVYNHIQYKFDQQGLEQLRRPARSWYEKKTGVDCDCMSIFVSSILTNLQIPHSFRITKYSKPNWQHVYVIVPDGRGTIAIDAVVAKFNYEKPYQAKKDYVMDLQGIDVAVLSGIENDELSEVLFGLDFDDELGSLTDEQYLEKFYRHLVATRNVVAKNPHMVAHVDDPKGFLKMLDYAIQYWNTDKRSEALDNLVRYEEQLNIKNGFSGDEDLLGNSDENDLSSIYGDLAGYDNLDELGAFKPKKLFKNIGKAVKKVGKAVGKGVKAVGKGIATAAKAVGKAVLKFNPLSIAARAGFLLALKLNLKKMGTKLKWGYATKEQAAKKGVSAADWQKSKDAIAKVEKLFVSKLQGKSSALKNAVLKGKAGNLNGIVEYTEDFSEFHGLGIAPAAALAAAVPIITAAMKILKSVGLVKPGEDTDTSNIAKEIDGSSASVMQTIESEDPDMQQIPKTFMATTTTPNFGTKLLSTVQNVSAFVSNATKAVTPVKQAVQQLTVKPQTIVAPTAVAQTPVALVQQPVAVVPAQQTAVVQSQAATPPAPTATPPSSGGIMNFIKANPIPALIIGGVVAFGAYQLLKPKHSGVNGLGDVEGLGGTKRRRKAATKKKPAKRKTATKSRVKRVKLF